MKVGDLVRMLPKNYSTPGHHIADQWKGLIGVITEDLSQELHVGRAYSVFIKHPDDPVPSEVYALAGDIEVINEDG